MHLALLGSWKDAQENELPGYPLQHAVDFEKFCLELGQSLVQRASKRKHISVHVASDKPHTPERYLVDGIVKSLGSRAPQDTINIRIIAYEKDTHTPFQKEFEKYPGYFFRSNAPAHRRVALLHLRMLRYVQLLVVVGGGYRSLNAGIAASLMRVRLLPVGWFGGAGKALLKEVPQLRVDTPAKLPDASCELRLNSSSSQALDAVLSEIDGYPRLMIIHGRDTEGTKDLVGLLAELGVSKPIVMQQEHGIGLSIPEKFEQAAHQADAAIAMFTADDLAAAARDRTGEPVRQINSMSIAHRARQNVVLEYGWFWARRGRNRVLMLVKGDSIELPSDLDGLMFESYSDSVQTCKDAIQRFVEELESNGSV